MRWEHLSCLIRTSRIKGWFFRKLIKNVYKYVDNLWVKCVNIGNLYTENFMNMQNFN